MNRLASKIDRQDSKEPKKKNICVHRNDEACL